MTAEPDTSTSHDVSRALLGLSLAAVLCGCPDKAAIPPIDAGGLESPDAGVDAGVVVVDAGPPPLTLLVRFEAADGGPDVVIDTGADAGLVFIEPARAIELRASLGLEDVRVRLFDWSDAVVPGDDQLESTDAGFRYRIELAAPLKTGRSYSLLLDGETQDAFRDQAGREHLELRVNVRVTGEVQPEPGARPKRPARKRR